MGDIIGLWLASVLVILTAFPDLAASQSCGRYEKKCPGGTCEKNWVKCPECPAYEKLCPDGTCIRLLDSCLFKGCAIDRKKCPDGRCVPFDTKCYDGCGYKEKKCDHGKCVAIDRHCPEEECPEDKNLRCDDGDCYAPEEKCDGTAFCRDGSDEDNCTFNLQKILDTPWILVLISVIIFALFCLLIALCCRYRHKEETRRKERRVARHRQQNPQHYEMPVVAGRRMQPLTSRQQSSHSQPGQDPRSPSFSSVPSPYNPELIPFMSPASYGSPVSREGFPQSAAGRTPQPTEPSAPPLGLEPHLAPPPYHEAMGEDFVPAQPGIPGRDYLPSYETVQRSGPPPGPGSNNSPRA